MAHRHTRVLGSSGTGCPDTGLCRVKGASGRTASSVAKSGPMIATGLRTPMRNANDNAVAGRALPKCPTGIQGLDEITHGGLPGGVPHSFAVALARARRFWRDFLVNGAEHFDEPGVLMTFEENGDELAQRRRLARLRSAKWLRSARSSSITSASSAARSRRPANTTSKACSSGSITRSSSIGAKRVVLDTIESLFAGL